MDSGKYIGQFTLIGNHSITLSETTLPVGGTKRVHLVGVKVKSFREVKIVSSDASIVSASIHKAPFDGPRGIWAVDLKSNAKGTARIVAKFLGAVVATLEVEAVTLNAISVPMFRTEPRPFNYAAITKRNRRVE